MVDSERHTQWSRFSAGGWDRGSAAPAWKTAQLLSGYRLGGHWLFLRRDVQLNCGTRTARTGRRDTASSWVAEWWMRQKGKEERVRGASKLGHPNWAGHSFKAEVGGHPKVSDKGTEEPGLSHQLSEKGLQHRCGKTPLSSGLEETTRGCAAWMADSTSVSLVWLIHALFPAQRRHLTDGDSPFVSVNAAYERVAYTLLSGPLLCRLLILITDLK